jgi:hypothetical protein
LTLESVIHAFFTAVPLPAPGALGKCVRVFVRVRV